MVQQEKKRVNRVLEMGLASLSVLWMVLGNAGISGQLAVLLVVWEQEQEPDSARNLSMEGNIVRAIVAKKSHAQIVSPVQRTATGVTTVDGDPAARLVAEEQ